MDVCVLVEPVDDEEPAACAASALVLASPLDSEPKLIAFKICCAASQASRASSFGASEPAFVAAGLAPGAAPPAAEVLSTTLVGTVLATTADVFPAILGVRVALLVAAEGCAGYGG